MRHSLSKRPASRSGGFSLIELSIVLIIMGLILVPLVKAYDVYQTKKRLDDTNINLRDLNIAISNFYGERGRYPCPSDRSLAFGQGDHGNEQCQRADVTPLHDTALEDLSPNTCGGSITGGFCSVTNSSGQAVYIGGVPYRTLDIDGSSTSGSQTIDGWKRNLTYAVTASLTDADTFDAADGGVEIINEHTTSMGSVHGIVFSAGKDGVGAFETTGVENPCVPGTVQSENCDLDAVFVKSIFIYEGDGATYYDDIVVSNDWTQTGIWSYVTGTDIANTNAGNIGIGTRTPGVKLDVIGDVRSTDRLLSPQFCNTDGTDCFPAQNIGGAGMQCPGGAGQYAYAIQNNRLLCRSPFAVTGSTTCPNNHYVTGITASGVTCAPLPTP